MEILEDLWNTKLNYKGVRVNFFGVPRSFLDKNKEPAVKMAICRLKKNGYIEVRPDGEWKITKSGKNFLYEKRKGLKEFRSPFTNNTSKNLLIVFDIPELMKKERAWFRKHLIKFNYLMIQKSVWVGPSPLPKEFVSYVEEIGLLYCLKTFRLSSPYRKKK